MRKEKRKTRNKNKNNESYTWYFTVMVFALMMGCNNPHEANLDVYTCPMHPTVVSAHASTCPVCGMDLVKKLHVHEDTEAIENLADLTASPSETIISSIKTIRGQYKKVPTRIEANGIVTYNEQNTFAIPAKVDGRIENTYLKYAYQQVSEGQKVAEIYSPELITAQRELIFLLEKDVENRTTIEAAENKLMILGLTQTQLTAIVNERKIKSTVSIYSPYTGYIIPRERAPAITSSSIKPTTAMTSSMEEATSSSASDQTFINSSILREGTNVVAGQALFNVINISSIRIEFDLPVQQAGVIKEGAKLELDFGNGILQQATVDFVQPFFTKEQYFIKIRVRPNELNGLYIGRFVKVDLLFPSTESIWIPRESVLDLGENKIVFVKKRGVLHPKKIITGITSNGQTEIKSGLASSEEIASNAQFLVDSESFIKKRN